MKTRAALLDGAPAPWARRSKLPTDHLMGEHLELEDINRCFDHMASAALAHSRSGLTPANF